jgi:rhamnosyltransferase
LKSDRFLVLLAAYNGIKCLEEQVESILRQQDVQVSILINVDASTDGTESWVDALKLADTRVMSLPFGSRFGGAAANFFSLVQAAKLENFDYIAFSDQDDIWEPSKLKNARSLLRNTNADAYSSNVVAFWENGRTQLISKSQPQTKYDYIFESAGPGCTYVFTNRVMSEIQVFTRAHYVALLQIDLHDWFYYAYVRSRGYVWVIDKWPSVRYRQHQHNQFGANSGLVAVRSRLSKIMCGWWLAQSRSISSLLDVKGLPFSSKERMSVFDYFKLALMANECRRQRRDKLIFFVMYIMLGLKSLFK